VPAGAVPAHASELPKFISDILQTKAGLTYVDPQLWFFRTNADIWIVQHPRRRRQLDVHPSRAFAKRKWSLLPNEFLFARRAAPMLVALAAALTLADSFTWLDRRRTNLTVSRVYARCNCSANVLGYPCTSIYASHASHTRGTVGGLLEVRERRPGVYACTRWRDGVLCVWPAPWAPVSMVMACALVVWSGWTKSQTPFFITSRHLAWLARRPWKTCAPARPPPVRERGQRMLEQRRHPEQRHTETDGQRRQTTRK